MEAQSRHHRLAGAGLPAHPPAASVLHSVSRVQQPDRHRMALVFGALSGLRAQLWRGPSEAVRGAAVPRRFRQQAVLWVRGSPRSPNVARESRYHFWFHCGGTAGAPRAAVVAVPLLAVPQSPGAPPAAAAAWIGDRWERDGDSHRCCISLF